MGFDTRAIHAGQEPDPSNGAIMTPIFQTSTYVQSSPGHHQGFEYTRTHNPTRNALEDCLASLEKGKHGVAFASGCAATSTIMHMLNAGDHVVSGDDVYGGTYRLFTKVFRPMGIGFSFVDMTDLDAFKAALTPATRLVWLESPTNPMLKICDIQAICEIAHEQGIPVVVDNTFMSPYFQNPLVLGADLVVHSTTKFINGHSDVVGGVVITNDDEAAEKLRFLQNSIGAVPGPFDSWLVLRGVKTLAVRMRQHAANAQVIAEYLEKHEAVEKVIYPGLESHPQHAIAKKQMSGFGGMITFVLKDGLEPARKMLERVKVFALAESLGGVESLIEHPAIMTHASVPPEVRAELGISDGLVRLSVGIEDVQDLLADLEQALS
ncbi:cystathionine gamma-synthase [Bradymonadaceae bacterium TMQ3]|uniref:Cystathionine gamma-synthase n=1 Tax=Lujinxingia sediminis TaxID=2480984 RepID=A0ABY0CTP4_9DELT|nr:cystathionine gamma-synthase [Bradymonadaceae bacterium TMQ3]RVU44201.1 cystathionine gamma-synthase [Lujinxingia sediminis]TXC76867.1 cystathionine gamma-synthase [Bradymonadales bacterium TMQ1]